MWDETAVIRMAFTSARIDGQVLLNSSVWRAIRSQDCVRCVIRRGTRPQTHYYGFPSQLVHTIGRRKSLHCCTSSWRKLESRRCAIGEDEFRVCNQPWRLPHQTEHITRCCGDVVTRKWKVGYFGEKSAGKAEVKFSVGRNRKGINGSSILSLMVPGLSIAKPIHLRR